MVGEEERGKLPAMILLMGRVANASKYLLYTFRLTGLSTLIREAVCSGPWLIQKGSQLIKVQRISDCSVHP